MTSDEWTSDAWLERDRRFCWHPYTQHGLEPDPLPVARAEGAWLELADGRRMLDGISSWWACLHGHGHPKLVAAIHEQAQTLDHVLFAGCTHEPAGRLAERLVAATDSLADARRKLTRVFYSDDGSTAVEVAMKAAYGVWARRGEPDRTLFLALEGGYHGDTVGAMSAGEPDPFFLDYKPFLFRVERVAPDADALEAALKASAGCAAALLLEPLVQGAAGMRMYAPSFLQDARRLCDEHDVFLIADEVMTGFGRTGSLFACGHAGICPDLMCLSKGLTGGLLPMSATMATEEVYAAFLSQDRRRAFFHGHTFTANPIGCAVALASLDVVEEEDTPRRLADIGTRIASVLAPLRDDPRVVDVRHLGGIVAVELKVEDGGYLAALGERLRGACRDLPDVLLRPLGNVLYALPPACTSPEECDLIAGRLQEVLERAGGRP